MAGFWLADGLVPIVVQFVTSTLRPSCGGQLILLRHRNHEQYSYWKKLWIALSEPSSALNAR